MSLSSAYLVGLLNVNSVDIFSALLLEVNFKVFPFFPKF